MISEAFQERRLKELRTIAESKGGSLLSTRYRNGKAKLRLRCEQGHEWRAIPNNVLRGHWCCVCGNERQGRAKAHSIEMMRKVAATKGGECLSQTYRNNLTRLRWRCKHGHEWEAVPGSIVGSAGRKGTWCPICAGKLPKEMALQHLKEVASSRGGRLVSKRYRNARASLWWRCAIGHEWDAAPDGVKHGHWCPKCAGSYPLTLRQMQKAARVFGGKCLSKRYLNSDTHLRWKCAEGHEWKAKPYHILKGHWCPVCSAGVSERICRALLERITRVRFPKVRPGWLKNERGGQMELDGYASSLSLAFEYQGHQHFSHVSFFHADKSDFKRRQHDDRRKRRLCRRYGVALLEVPYFVPHDRLQNYLATQLRALRPGLIRNERPVNIARLGIRLCTPYHRRRGAAEPAVGVAQLGIWCRTLLKGLQSIAAARGGELISRFYVDSSTKLRWRCAVGHTWKAIPYSIKRGSWCPKCGIKRSAIKRAHTVDDMQALAKAKGGTCLSTSYRNSKSRLRWRCAQGHEWETQASVILSGHWCPKCEKFRLGRKYALTLDVIQRTAKERGGQCLSETYLNARERLMWRCAKGHTWRANTNSIRRGSWCPFCAGKSPKPLY